MTSITIHNLDDGLKQRLRLRAAEHGRSIVRRGVRDFAPRAGGTRSTDQSCHSDPLADRRVWRREVDGPWTGGG